jgi:hypothetical protein
VGLKGTVAKQVGPQVPKMAPKLNHGFVRQAVDRAIAGAGPLPAAAEAGDKHLADENGDVDKAVSEIVRNHTAMAGVQGFVTNLGGLVAVPVTIPVNIVGLALLQCRMVAAIAHLRGHDLDDPRVRNAILVCTLGEESASALTKAGKLPGTPRAVASGTAPDPEVDRLISAEVTSALVSRVIGKRAAATVVRRVPVAGGVFGGSADAYATWQVGRYAAREFVGPNAPAPAPAKKRFRRERVVR